LGRKLSCWWDKIGKAALDAIKAGLTILVGGGEFEFKDIKKAAFKAGGISLVINVISIFLDPACRCNEDEPSGTACEKAKGISIFPGNCNTLEQIFKAWGYSAPPGTVFEWIVQNGTFPDNNNTTSITTISPEVKVRQNDPNVPITLAVNLSCFNPQPNYFITPEMSIPELVNDPGTLIIWGEKELYPSSTYHYKYEFWGTWLNNINSVIIYSGCSPHGQVVESGIDYVKIQWNSASPSYPTPKVTAIAKNLCSQLTVTENLDIIIH
ncbi:MAG: hypothetical protein H6560_11765, partial [Lewinellaceae bacterium]|nr:hypothetical protein [Lewinellaceae bacterium]